MDQLIEKVKIKEMKQILQTLKFIFKKIKALLAEACKVEKQLAHDMKAGGSNIRNAPHYENLFTQNIYI